MQHQNTQILPSVTLMQQNILKVYITDLYLLFLLPQMQHTNVDSGQSNAIIKHWVCSVVNTNL